MRGAPEAAPAGADVIGLVAVGEQLPYFELLDHASNRRSVSQLVGGDPAVMQFYLRDPENPADGTRATRSEVFGTAGAVA
jgi:hypothetical protein